VYGSILTSWFGVSATTVKTLIYNNFTQLPLLKNCALSTDAEDITIEDITVRTFPNPFRDQTRITFRLNVGAYTRVSIFDMLGSELSVLSNQQLPSGDHQFDFNGSHLPVGAYICRVQAGREVMTLRLIKN
jgi:Secretion system C-terminal sorting domain